MPHSFFGHTIGRQCFVDDCTTSTNRVCSLCGQHVCTAHDTSPCCVESDTPPFLKLVDNDEIDTLNTHLRTATETAFNRNLSKNLDCNYCPSCDSIYYWSPGRTSPHDPSVLSQNGARMANWATFDQSMTDYAQQQRDNAHLPTPLCQSVSVQMCTQSPGSARPHNIIGATSLSGFGWAGSLREGLAFLTDDLLRTRGAIPLSLAMIDICSRQHLDIDFINLAQWRNVIVRLLSAGMISSIECSNDIWQQFADIGNFTGRPCDLARMVEDCIVQPGSALNRFDNLNRALCFNTSIGSSGRRVDNEYWWRTYSHSRQCTNCEASQADLSVLERVLVALRLVRTLGQEVLSDPELLRVLCDFIGRQFIHQSILTNANIRDRASAPQLLLGTNHCASLIDTALQCSYWQLRRHLVDHNLQNANPLFCSPRFRIAYPQVAMGILINSCANTLATLDEATNGHRINLYQLCDQRTYGLRAVALQQRQYRATPVIISALRQRGFSDNVIYLILCYMRR